MKFVANRKHGPNRIHVTNGNKIFKKISALKELYLSEEDDGKFLYIVNKSTPYL